MRNSATAKRQYSSRNAVSESAGQFLERSGGDVTTRHSVDGWVVDPINQHAIAWQVKDSALISSRSTALWWRDIIDRHAETKAPKPELRRSREEVADQFEFLAARWEDETVLESRTTVLVSHPAYLRIIGLGLQAVPLILRRMQEFKGMWFPALVAITGEDPAAGIETPATARSAWLDWGRARGLVE